MNAVDVGIIAVARADALSRLDVQERIRRAAMRRQIAEFMRFEAPKLLEAGANVEEVTDAAVSSTRTALALDAGASGTQPALDA